MQLAAPERSGDRGCDFSSEAASHPGFVGNHQAMRAPHGFEHGGGVPRCQRAEVDDFDADVLLFESGGRMHGKRNRRTPCDDREIAADLCDARGADGHHVVFERNLRPPAV